MMKTLACLATALALGACGDNNVDPDPDAAPPEIDAPPDVPASTFVPPTPFAISLSVAGPDQLQSATAAPDGKFYAAGFAAATVAGTPRFVTVVKLTTTGLDTTWGTNGIVTTPLDFKGGSDEVDITTQSDGKILVSATVANSVNAADRDIAVIRLLDTGAIDTTFNSPTGFVVVSLNDATLNTAVPPVLTGFDASRGLTVDANGIYVHAISRAFGTVTGGTPRLDTDFVVVKLTSAGAVDNTFGTNNDGQFRLDIQQSNATARGIKALADGSLIVSGYANSTGVGSTQPVLYKLTSAGILDPAWTNGVFHEVILTRQTEVYNFAVHGTHFTTAGYGNNAGIDTNDYVSLRFDIATGARDTAWGGAALGAVLFDPSGTMLGSNCRNAIALPDGKTLMTGSTGPSNMPAQDAVFAVLDATGALDTKYGDGIHVFPLGSNGNDQFWGGAVSGNNIAIVGYKGGFQTQTDTVNDDAYGAVFEVQ